MASICTPEEAVISEALKASNVKHLDESKATQHLDFLLLDSGVYIECKGGPVRTDKPTKAAKSLLKQIERGQDVIVVIGMKAAKQLAAFIDKKGK